MILLKKMVCEERDRLFAEYRIAVKKWTELAINIKPEPVFHQRVSKAMERLEDAKFQAHLARIGYENHLQRHLCDGELD
jgi:hypothetical protein